jgi:hypothetical protein
MAFSYAFKIPSASTENRLGTGAWITHSPSEPARIHFDDHDLFERSDCSSDSVHERGSRPSHALLLRLQSLAMPNLASAIIQLQAGRKHLLAQLPHIYRAITALNGASRGGRAQRRPTPQTNHCRSLQHQGLHKGEMGGVEGAANKALGPWGYSAARGQRP